MGWGPVVLEVAGRGAPQGTARLWPLGQQELEQGPGERGGVKPSGEPPGMAVGQQGLCRGGGAQRVAGRPGGGGGGGRELARQWKGRLEATAAAETDSGVGGSPHACRPVGSSDGPSPCWLARETRKQAPWSRPRGRLDAAAGGRGVAPAQEQAAVAAATGQNRHVESFRELGFL